MGLHIWHLEPRHPVVCCITARVHNSYCAGPAIIHCPSLYRHLSSMRKSRHSAPPPLTAAFDRGPAKYFHGRKEILSNFNELTERAVQAKSGTTFLIQGAPGAGKTALLEECEKMAKDQGWKTAKIDPPALWDPEALRDFLGLRKFSITGGSLQLGPKNVASAAITVELTSRTIGKILRKGKQPLLLTLDEAQTLGTTSAPPSDQTRTVTNVLKAIHNGNLNYPVILMAAGLGTTVDAFESLGISRFSGKCFVELGALSKESERAVIHDWLKKDGGAKGDPEEWIDAIAQETHGWPQHILSYVEPAGRQLDAKKKAMTTEGLNAVLEAGRVFRSRYYERRADGISRKQRRSLAKLIADVPLGEGLDKEDIMASLAQEYGPDEAKKLFRKTLHRGILHRHGGIYAVPIPSMQDWLVSNYAHIQIKSPSQTVGLLGSGGRHMGPEIGR